MSRISRDDMFMEMVQIVAERSTCLRLSVGAMIVHDGRPISIGYNGPAANRPECLPAEAMGVWGSAGVVPLSPICMGSDCNRSIHAEANAIAFAAKHGIETSGCTLYCTDSPCINCAKLILSSGITRVVYMREYRDRSGIEFLGAQFDISQWAPGKYTIYAKGALK